MLLPLLTPRQEIQREKERGERRGNRALNDTHAFERPVRVMARPFDRCNYYATNISRNYFFHPRTYVYIYVCRYRGDGERWEHTLVAFPFPV